MSAVANTVAEELEWHRARHQSNQASLRDYMRTLIETPGLTSEHMERLRRFAERCDRSARSTHLLETILEIANP